MKYLGKIKGGVVVLDAPDHLPEGTVVEIEPVGIPFAPDRRPSAPVSSAGGSAVGASNPDPASDDADNPLLKMLELAGPTGIPDLATNIDHYLYGHPKVDDDEG